MVAEPAPDAAAGGAAGAASHIAALDALRGLAVLLVVAAHSLAGIRTASLGRAFTFGWTGVDLFFVLSGFLITRILLHSRDRSGFLRTFVARRALRIWPAYLMVVLLAFAGVARIPDGPLAFNANAYPWYVYALYLQNLWFKDPGPWLLSPTWSLAIEEQYYLVWPVLVALLPRRALVAILAVVVVGMPLVRIASFLNGATAFEVYTATWCRLDGLALGGLVAFLAHARGGSLPEALTRRAAVLVVPALLVMALWIASRFFVTPVNVLAPVDAARAVETSLLYSWTAAAYALLVVGALHRTPSRWWAAALRARWLHELGRLSYGIYLYHVGVFTLFAVLLKPWLDRAAPWPPAVSAAVMIGLEWGAVYGVAWGSRRWLEEPFLRLKTRV
jgi:peptidoglycan/LPS O-acetylase OafA/YrhL